MSKYIKLEDAIERKNQLYHSYEVEEWLKSLPTIEVVFCEECKYAPYCEQRLVKEMFGNEIAEWQEVDFCQHGERIDNEREGE